ncbi:MULTISPECIES: Lrp/AsnC ligand binding domain-containing protein [Nitrosarchaeum]|uniref:Transcriptional regulator, AsnC family n=1 Tax=Nitrosarchaeum koreense MY1 TaxID=1001994 RepID=F9CUH4_9ARCH|nr:MULTISPECIES: Lrp/AsnC ligand binding domain-containing protein [Nitrosarchaeum]EGP94608.1 Transcriptional regulator, AsnC family [Nitrosarchaeum koreense MY1]MBS3921760.1 Lrp/AsnC ligand binding domain-containing protein [Nitrosarchaeum sp.]MBS3925324.1 Lrp/AsnC ligand binding domain-containing protein [Nitrosarchaeum sp.]MCV0412537.1 Lrp/AsnC ligand binding domain-containing protein [Nitrosarchaeum sp.]MEC4849097.1 Lrp/AsnC ligand binding domain-containing protein [Nitrosarchaeum sp.]
MPTAYVLLNSDLGSDESIIEDIKRILATEDIEYEVQGVYGVYDIVLKLSSKDAEKLRGIITNKVRKIGKIQSTLTMMVIEEQEKS